MGFEEDLTATVQETIKEREKIKGERKAFDLEWQRARREDLLPLFEVAAKVLRQSLGKGEAKLHNGSIVLETACDGREHALTFSPDKTEPLIWCSSSLEGHKAESFTADNLGADTVRHNLHEFAAGAARGKWKPRPPSPDSPYEDHGLRSF